MEKWVIRAKKADFNALGKELRVSPITARLMVNRGLENAEDMKMYIYGDLKSLHNPFSMKDIVRGARLVANAIKEGKKIRVASDFDVDGIFSAHILVSAIKELGGNVNAEAPDRIAEGYGLNTRMVEEAYRDGVSLILTCDNGIAAFEPIERAKELGMTVVVTDHHDVPFTENEVGEKVYNIPCADAVINPKQADCNYPFKGLCGAGVAFKFVQVLYDLFEKDIEEANPYLEFAAVATVADVMELKDENRIIVKYGIFMLQKTENPGLSAVIEEQALKRESISSYTIGFVIGPCFNAAGRLSTVKNALRLLETDDKNEAKALAAELKALNDKRKELTERGTEMAFKIIENNRTYDNDKVLIIYLGDCHESIVGIIAGRVKEKFNKPTVVFADSENGIVKGSGRSIEAYNMFEKFSKCKDIFTKFGGHPMAAGMSLKFEDLEELRRRVNADAGLTDDDIIKKVYIDIPMPIQYVSEPLVNELKLLEPFGNGNTKPMFADKHLRILSARRIGAQGAYVKLRVENRDGARMDAMYFGDANEFDRFIEEEFSVDTRISIYEGRRNDADVAFIYYPDINEFRGRKTPQIIVQSYCRI